MPSNTPPDFDRDFLVLVDSLHEKKITEAEYREKFRILVIACLSKKTDQSSPRD
jgi:hypothetical protein